MAMSRWCFLHLQFWSQFAYGLASKSSAHCSGLTGWPELSLILHANRKHTQKDRSDASRMAGSLSGIASCSQVKLVRPHSEGIRVDWFIVCWETTLLRLHVRLCWELQNYRGGGSQIREWQWESQMSRHPLIYWSSISPKLALPFQLTTLIWNHIRKAISNPNLEWPYNKPYSLCSTILFPKLGKLLGRIAWIIYIDGTNHWSWHCVAVREMQSISVRWSDA